MGAVGSSRDRAFDDIETLELAMSKVNLEIESTNKIKQDVLEAVDTFPSMNHYAEFLLWKVLPLAGWERVTWRFSALPWAVQTS